MEEYDVEDYINKLNEIGLKETLVYILRSEKNRQNILKVIEEHSKINPPIHE